MTKTSVSDVKKLIALLAGRQDDIARWPLLRRGNRAEIPWWIRRAIYQRDGGRCLSCGVQLAYEDAQLDHIVPWSAGGSDRSDNLRILCGPCNSGRSNFRGSLDTWGANRQPVAFCCVNCIGDDQEYWGYPVTNELSEGAPETVSAFCVHCGFVSRTWQWETC